MKTINYVTNIPRAEISGGGSGINDAVVNQLNRRYDLNYIGPVNVEVNKIEYILSKANRMVGLKGKYHFFSEARLTEIAKIVEWENEKRPSDINFFHHATSWIKVKNKVPYCAYTDACFATYVEIYNNKSEFLREDLKRIYDQEAKFMNDANAIFFRSKWAMDETKRAYGLSGDNFKVVRFGGGIEKIPETDKYAGGVKLLFISREFEPKGGYTVLKAFEKFHQKYPESELVVIGDQPKPKIDLPGVCFEGFLDKATFEGKTSFNQHLEEAFALIHPTNKDTNTLVIAEAAYFGCPTIASNSFAIPEFIENGVTGYLLNQNTDENEIVSRLITMVEDPMLYKQLRKNVRDKAMKFYTWETVGNTLEEQITKF